MEGFEKFNSNPFASILAQTQGQGQQQSQQPSGNPQGRPMMPGMEENDNQLMKGKGAGATPHLMGAVQALQKFITEATEPGDIAAARSIITLISRLISKDQERMSQRLQQDSEMMQRA